MNDICKKQMLHCKCKQCVKYWEDFPEDALYVEYLEDIDYEKEHELMNLLDERI